MNQPLPSAKLTNAFNALYVQASIELEGGVAKVMLMNMLRRTREELTHYQPHTDDNFYSRFRPHILENIQHRAKDPWGSYDCKDLHLIVPQVRRLLDLHASKCPCSYPVFTTLGECFQCGKIHKTD